MFVTIKMNVMRSFMRGALITLAVCSSFVSAVGVMLQSFPFPPTRTTDIAHSFDITCCTCSCCTGLNCSFLSSRRKRALSHFYINRYRQSTATGVDSRRAEFETFPTLRNAFIRTKGAQGGATRALCGCFHKHPPKAGDKERSKVKHAHRLDPILLGC